MAGNGEDLRKLTSGQLKSGMDRIPASAKSGEKFNIGGVAVTVYRPPPAPVQGITLSPEVTESFQAAVKAAQEGKYDLAIRFLTQCTQEEPRFGSGWARLGMLYQLTRRYEEARQCLQRAILVFPKCVDAMYALGILEDKSGNHATATEFYQKLFTIYPWGKHYIGEINDLRSKIAEKSGNWQLPIEIYQLGLKYWPGETYFWNMLATDLNETGQFQEAIYCGLYAKVLGDNFLCDYILGCIYARQNKYGHAAWYFQTFQNYEVGKNPNRLALIEAAQGKLREVEANASAQGINITPTSATVPWSPTEMNQLKIQACEYCLTLVPEHVKGWFSLGDLNYRLEHWDAAIIALLKAIDYLPVQNPHEPCLDRDFLLTTLAKVYLHARQLDRAMEMAQLAVKDKDYSPGWSILAEIYVEQGNLAGAEHAARQVLIDHPQEMHSLAVIAKIRHKQGKPEEAVKIYKGLCEDQLNGAFYLNDLGELYRSIGEEELARDCFQQALAKTPDDKRALRNLSENPANFRREFVKITPKALNETLPKCPRCNGLIKDNCCESCGRKKCLACGEMNDPTKLECVQCRTPLP